MSLTQNNGWRGTAFAILCMFMLQPWHFMSNKFERNSKIQNLRQISNHPLDPYFKGCCLQLKGSVLHCNWQLSALQNLARNHANSTKHVLRTMWYIKVSCELVFLEQLRKYSKLLPICGIYTEKFWEILQTNIELYTCKQDLCALLMTQNITWLKLSMEVDVHMLRVSQCENHVKYFKQHHFEIPTWNL